MLKTKQELFQTKEYWIDELQNEIYRQVSDFMKKNELNQIQLANQLGVSKGYVSQILNGDCNFTLKKIVELSLALGKAPIVNYVDLIK
jgi:predicted XRE-type DNA-binding protein